MAAGRTTRALSQWSQGLDALRVVGGGSDDPKQLHAQAELLTLLGRGPDAQPVVARLDAMHYRDPEFVTWRDAGSVVNTP